MAENTDYETLKNAISNIKKDLECPICLDVVKHPFKQCARGHLVCVGCLNTLTACPTCQGALSLENPVCIKNLLEHLPQDCRYSANGCKKIVENGDSHEKFCGFRSIKCKQEGGLGCKQDISVGEILEHIKTIHPNTFIFNEKKLNNMIYKNFNPVVKRVCSNLVHLFDNFFWFTLNNSVEEKQLKLMLEAIPIGKLDGDYYVKLSLINGDFEFKSTLKAFSPEEIEEAGQEANVESNRINQSCMTIPQTMLPHFINIRGSLTIHEIIFFKG